MKLSSRSPHMLRFRVIISLVVLATFCGLAFHATRQKPPLEHDASARNALAETQPLRSAPPPSFDQAGAALMTPPKTPAQGTEHDISSPLPPASKKKTPPEPWDALIARLVADGFEEARLRAAFTALGSSPQPAFMGQKAVELYARYGKASLLVPDDDKAAFAPPDYARNAGGVSVTAGRRVIDGNRQFFESLYASYGVPAPFIVAILMVETGIGQNLGAQSALLALGSMAVTSSLEQVLPVVSGIASRREELDDAIRTRSAWAYEELKALITYAGQTGKDVWAIPGSVYGAIGICQFMPSNIAAYGASTSKKRPVPDLFLLTDAAASAAKYLSRHGWKNAATPMAQLAVLRTYNRSDVYASTVYGVATALMAPTTHAGAQSARTGGNAVRAARENARASIPAGNKKVPPLKIPGYDTALE